MSFGGGYAGGALTPLGPVTLNNTIQPMTSASAYTISFWVDTLYPSAAGNYATGPILSSEAANPLGGCVIANGVRSQIPINCSGNPGGAFANGTTAVGAVNVWTNVVLSYAGPGADVNIYINGNLQRTLTNTNKADVFSTLQAANMVLGGTPGANGLVPIDELRVYNTALTPQQICTQLDFGTISAASGQCLATLPGDDVNVEIIPPAPMPPQLPYLLNSGSWQDAVTLTTAAFTYQPGFLGQGVYVKPTTAQLPAIMVAANATEMGANAHTVTFWFMDPSGKGMQDVFSNLSDAGYKGRASGGNLEMFGQGQSNTGGLVSFDVSIPYSIGKWHQVMVVDDDTVSILGGKALGTTEIDIYLDGSLTKVVPISPAAAFWTNGTSGPQLGGSLGGTPPPPTPDVYIDELKVWPYDLVKINNAQGEQEALCLLGFGGAFDPTTGNCTFP